MAPLLLENPRLGTVAAKVDRPMAAGSLQEGDILQSLLPNCGWLRK